MLRKILTNPLPGEHATVLINKHWITFLPEVLIRLVFAVIPTLLFFSLRWYGVDFSLKFGDPNYGLVWILLYMYYAGLLLSLYVTWVDFSLDIWLLTNQRVIHVEQKSLFSRVIIEHSLDRIQNAESNVAGFFRTVLNYGDVVIQTASEGATYKFGGIARPAEVVRQIIELQHQVMSQTSEGDAEKNKITQPTTKVRPKDGL